MAKRFRRLIILFVVVVVLFAAATITWYFLQNGQISEKILEIPQFIDLIKIASITFGILTVVMGFAVAMHYSLLRNDQTRLKSLEQTAEQFQLLVNTAQEAIVVLSNGILVFCNKQITTLSGYSPEEVIGKSFMDFIHPDSKAEVMKNYQSVISEKIHVSETPFIVIAKSGQRIWVRPKSVKSSWKGNPAVFSLLTDITEQTNLQVDQKRAESKFQSIFENMNAGMALVSQDGFFINVNTALHKMLGFRQNELVGKHFLSITHPDDLEKSKELVASLLAGKIKNQSIEKRYIHKDGSDVWGNTSVTLMRDAKGQPENFVVHILNISNEKSAFDAIKNLAKFPAENPSPVIRINRNCEILYANPASIGSVLPASAREAGKAPKDWHRSILEALETGKPIQKDYKKSGKTFSITFTPIKDGDYVNAYARDVSEQIAFEKKLKESETQYRMLFEGAPVAYLSIDGKGIIRDVNDYALNLFGFSWEEAINTRFTKFLPGIPVKELVQVFADVYGGMEVKDREFVVQRKSGEQLTVMVNARAIGGLGKKDSKVYCAIYNITDRKKMEEDVRLSEEKFSKAFNTSPDSININRLSDGMYIDVNPGWTNITGYTREETLGHTSKEISIWANMEDRARLVEGLQRNGVVVSLEAQFQFKSGEIRTGLMSARTMMVNNELCILSVTRDIHERKQAENAIKSQVMRLSALRAIDTAITSSLDLAVVMQVIVNEAIKTLKVDAAVAFLFDPQSNELKWVSDSGLTDLKVRTNSLKLNDCYAGKAVLTRGLIKVLEAGTIEGPIAFKEMIRRENFSSYFAIPLIAKGVVSGVLELFSKSSIDPDGEWINFLEALAGQAAIAIDNASLYMGLQQANFDMRLAYDATIEGWAKALELRDGETEGHSKRVTEKTLEIARMMNISESELVHLKRGAFLHDIGKMGIPDHILLKPGPLTEDEWITMRQHPSYAYKLLLSVDFLRPALDIPYCHHERWNGSGYPRGLKGEEIPLAARIFAVVDVWDALLSDRPYRPGWPKEKVVDYLKEQKGIQFEPKLVDMFLDLINN